MSSAPAEPGPSLDRNPPQDIDAEKSVLGAMLSSKDAIADVVEEIKGVDFYRPGHELIFNTITDLYGRGGDGVRLGCVQVGFECDVSAI